jgi:1-aminocyclopropane-1-carboxylate deaminase/D-cysteine desulfhydrase-like pyridoxal-dependent ACC family enzyme
MHETSLKKLLGLPHIDIGNFPTPIESSTTLDNKIGHAVLIKRDDLSGYGRGGAKTRKLSYLFGWLLAHGYDELITCMGNISNLVFDMAPLLKRYGIHSSLFCMDIPPMLPAKRIELYKTLMGDIHLVGESYLAVAKRALSRYVRSRISGRQPALILPGVSHPSGVIGNAMGFIEMVQQARESKLPMPETVFVSAATGTTIAGFLLAERLLREAGWLSQGVRIIGVQIYPGPIRRLTQFLLNWTIVYLRLPLKFRFSISQIDWESDLLHGGFGCFGEEIARGQELFENATGICIDPFFSGKTFAALLRHVRNGKLPREAPVLFWHCGHTPNWQELARSTEIMKSANFQYGQVETEGLRTALNSH